MWDAEENKANLEADLRETRKTIRSCKKDLVLLKSAVNLSSRDILDCMDNIKQYEAGAKALEELIAELFD